MGLLKLGTSMIVPIFYGTIERKKEQVIIKQRSHEFNEGNISNATMSGYTS